MKKKLIDNGESFEQNLPNSKEFLAKGIFDFET